MAILHYRTLRFFALLKKELTVIKRDILTYIFIILIPFSEVILFGYIINTDAKHLPTIVVAHDTSQLTNSIIQTFRNTEYFSIKDITADSKKAEELMDKDKVVFIINIPSNFTRDLILNRHPHILLEGNAMDPVAVQNAFHTNKAIQEQALNRDAKGILHFLATPQAKFIVDNQAKYNPSVLTKYHTLPGLIVTILTLTLVMITAVSITSEFEYGTMETLLITPVKPIEVILGKIVPNLVIMYHSDSFFNRQFRYRNFCFHIG
jgi:ABC-2 type transport system permease protein